MAVIFNSGGASARGLVSALPASNASPGLLEVDGWGGFTGFKSIFTRVLIGEATNHQFQHTIGERIYLYVFGNRMGGLSLSGLSFFETCGQQIGPVLLADADQSIGISRVIRFFKQNRLSRREIPLRVTLDPTTVFEAYLQSLQCEAVSTASTVNRMYQFHMNLALPPDSTGERG